MNKLQEIFEWKTGNSLDNFYASYSSRHYEEYADKYIEWLEKRCTETEKKLDKLKELATDDMLAKADI
jgi:hypothetical protein